MNIQKGFWFGLMAIFTVLIVSSSAGAQSDTMTLDSRQGSKGKSRPPVLFPHSLHVEKGIDCKGCHHLYEKGQNVLDESKLVEGNPEIRCSACHKAGARLDLERAYHQQCIGCHQKPLKEKSKIPPRYCGGCHVRK